MSYYNLPVYIVKIGDTSEYRLSSVQPPEELTPKYTIGFHQETYRLIAFRVSSGFSSPLAESAFAKAPNSGAVAIKKVHYVPDAALVANDLAFATLTVWGRDPDGSHQTKLFERTTKTTGSGGTGDWTAFAPVDLGSQVGGTDPAADSSLTFQVGITGVVTVPSGVLVVEYRDV